MATPVTLVTDAGLPFGPNAAFPYGGLVVGATSGNAANAVATAILPLVPSKTNYLTGFQVTGTGATVALPAGVTITGLAMGTLTYTYAAVAGVLGANTPLMITLPVPLPASAPGTAISVSCGALGLGNTNNVVNAFGFVV